MIDNLERLAAFSTARACGFAAIAVVMMMLAFAGSGEPIAALKAGGIMMLIITAVLVLKAMNAHDRSYKNTELWILLRPDERPDAAIAQQIIGNVLHTTYLRFALQSTGLAIAMLASAVLMALFGVTGVDR
jgi:hypothetical protein